MAGLGRAFTLMLPAFSADPRIALVAAGDSRAEARDRFSADFGAPAYATVAELCADPRVEVVYVATPHEHHAEHALLGAAAGKHLLVEKPLAVTAAEGRAVVEAAERSRVHLIVGHSHSFDIPIKRTRTLLESGVYGKARLITALNFTDFLYRPRRPAELSTEQGGGIVFSQGAHQVDIARYLAASPVLSVRATIGAWDDARPTEGAYTALLTFANGASASLTYSGYGHFDSDELCGWVDELGRRKEPALYGSARRLLAQAAGPAQETAMKHARTYGGRDYRPDANAAAQQALHQHFGFVVVSCDRADLRPLPTGVMIYDDRSARLDPLPAPAVPRAEVIDELYAAVAEGETPVHDGAWALATLEVCLAILRSGREGQEIRLGATGQATAITKENRA